MTCFCLKFLGTQSDSRRTFPDSVILRLVLNGVLQRLRDCMRVVAAVVLKPNIIRFARARSLSAASRSAANDLFVPTG